VALAGELPIRRHGAIARAAVGQIALRAHLAAEKDTAAFTRSACQDTLAIIAKVAPCGKPHCGGM